MKSTCIDIPLPRQVPGPWPASRPRNRGTAEIETLLVILFLLLPLLFISAGVYTLGHARITNVFNAANNAYRQVVSGRGLVVSIDPLPVNGLNEVRPQGGGLTNRFAIAREVQNVAMNLDPENSVTPWRPTQWVIDQAVFLDPAWHFAAFPHPQDRPQTQYWFESYVAESHPPELVYSLGLRPPWIP